MIRPLSYSRRGAFLATWLIFVAACVVVIGGFAATRYALLPAIPNLLPSGWETSFDAIYKSSATFVPWSTLQTILSLEVSIRLGCLGFRWLFKLLPKPVGAGQS